MKNTKIIATLALIALVPFAAFAKAINDVPAENTKKVVAKKNSTPAGWTDDFEAAKKQAKAEGKDLLVAFSGSDWCGWCVRLEQEVFSKNDFSEKVSEFLVPVYIDNPSDTTRLSALAKQQNGKLTQRYRIESFPSVLLIDPDGDVFAQTGYREGGPEKYLEALKKLSAEGKDSAEYKALKTLAKIPKNKERIAKIDTVLQTLPLDAQIYNIGYVNEILAADPNGALGYRAKYPYFTVVVPLQNEFNEAMLELSRRADAEVKKAAPKDKAAYVKILSDVLCAAKNELLAYRSRAEEAKKLFPANSLAIRRLDEVSQYVNYILLNYIDKIPDTPQN